MRKVTMVVIAIVAISIIAGLIYFGVFGISGIDFNFAKHSSEDELAPENSTQLTLSNNDIFIAFETLTGQDLTYSTFAPYIDALHMKMWGINGDDALSVLNSYSSQYLADGWMSLGRNTQASTGWVAYMEGWFINQNARGIITGEGAAVTQVYGYDMVVLTSYGPLTTYNQFMQEVG
jgi:hypothetical protein